MAMTLVSDGQGGYTLVDDGTTAPDPFADPSASSPAADTSASTSSAPTGSTGAGVLADYNPLYGALADSFNGTSQPGQPAVKVPLEGANTVSGPQSATQPAAESPGVFGKILQGMGIQNKQGEIDYSDPKVMDKILKSLYVGGNILTTLQGPQNKKTASELTSQFKNQYDTFTPTAQTAANGYFGNAYQRHKQQAANSMSSPIVDGRRYAEGGGVEEGSEQQGPLSFVRGSDSGQADTVKANLSHGEYVFDADTVSALGDGNNEAGAKLLDKWREELRKQKRSAPPDKIPPKSKAPSHYLGKVK